MKPTLLVLTAGFGEGHNAAARALVAAADEALGEGGARAVDVFALARPRTNAWTRRAYLQLINRAPGLWRSAYGWLDRSPTSQRLFTGLYRERRTLRALLAQEQPRLLCSTYPLYAFMLQTLSRRSNAALPPHFNVVTDSISINSLWWRVPCEAWFVPNRDSAEVLHAAGIPGDRVQALGFPVAPFFATQARRLSAPPLGPEVRPRVLYIVNSGTRGAAETALRLLERDEWDVTCTVGRNAALGAQLERASARRPRPARIHGWTDEIPRLLMTHHVVVSKAGGATTQESIAAQCPMVVNHIVPGQEQGNYELLRRHGIGALATTPAEVIATLDRAFSNDAVVWRGWRAAVERLSRPGAAHDIVACLLAHLPSSRPVLAA